MLLYSYSKLRLLLLDIFGIVDEEEVKGDLLKALNVDDDVDGVDCVDDAQNARA